MKIYALSDTHFGHDKLVELSGRPKDFYDILLDNLDQSGGDVLIHCGDFCIGNDASWHQVFMDASKGFKRRVLVRGNHDGKRDGWYLNAGWDWVCESMTATYFGKHLLFTHIPTRRSSSFDANIHGHMHGNNHRKAPEDGYFPGWHKDLAPELHGYAPVKLENFLANL